MVMLGLVLHGLGNSSVHDSGDRISGPPIFQSQTPLFLPDTEQDRSTFPLDRCRPASVGTSEAQMLVDALLPSVQALAALDHPVSEVSAPWPFHAISGFRVLWR